MYIYKTYHDINNAAQFILSNFSYNFYIIMILAKVESLPIYLHGCLLAASSSLLLIVSAIQIDIFHEIYTHIYDRFIIVTFELIIIEFITVLIEYNHSNG